MSDKKPTRDEMRAVLEHLCAGRSWQMAVCETFGLPPSPKANSLAWRLKVDKNMRNLLKANQDRLGDPETAVDIQSTLRHMYEAQEYARAVCDGNLLLRATVERARAMGIIKDDRPSTVVLLTTEQKLKTLETKFLEMHKLSQIAEEKGIEVEGSVTPALPKPPPSG